MELVSETEQIRSSQKPFIVFTSFFSKDDSISRYIENNDHTGPGSYVNYKNTKLLYGEDPRTFILNGEKHVVSQRFIGSFDTVIQTVMNIDTGTTEQYTVENLPSYGKNWAPFVVGNTELYFIQCFNPLRIIYNHKVLCEIPTSIPLVSYPGSKPFSMFRGGSNGIQIGDLVFGFGHATIYQPSVIHTLTFWAFDTKNRTFEMGILKGYKPKYLIADPTSLWVENGDVYLSVFESSEQWFSMNVKTFTRIFKVDVLKIYSGITSFKYYQQITNIPL